ncbi:hypothetical protein SMD11_1259 [Streptomyces albireticuli]|uniref:Uncharacterized protein n=2 Tax=Streptomyces albireticuli TaxID=1940 RepID=A0A1Z2KY17_9ACTN|nr:hypothetical protein SMD11_1259 [Streptomyces albireticuli]
MMVWDGSRWVEGRTKTWTGSAWVERASVRYFDGEVWQAKPPAPVPFPQYAASTTSLSGKADYVGGPLPAVRVGDLVVSVCASTAMPQLASPPARISQTHQLSSGHWVAVAVWPYDGRGGDVVWQAQGSTGATTMTLVYRGGDISATTVTPVKEIKQYDSVNRVPLNAPAGYTSLFVVLAESADLTGYTWPDGVLPRTAQLGRFGDLDISLLAADTPGTGASTGQLILDTTAVSAACITIQIPGADDDRPTWILGDERASVLGTTTVLG